MGNALLATGVLSLSLVTLSQVTFQCSTDRVGCLAAAVSFSAPHMVTPEPFVLESTAVSTVALVENTPSMSNFLIEFIRVTSVYLILVGVVILVLLELRELHYLKRLTRRVKHS